MFSPSDSLPLPHCQQDTQNRLPRLHCQSDDPLGLLVGYDSNGNTSNDLSTMEESSKGSWEEDLEILDLDNVNFDDETWLVASQDNTGLEESNDNSLMILDLSRKSGLNSKNWLVSYSSEDVFLSPEEAASNSLMTLALNHPTSPIKQSLVSKLEDLKKGSPTRFRSANNSPYHITASSYYNQRLSGLESTPERKTFDSRTFTRGKKLSNLSPLRSYNAGSDMTIGDLNATFTKLNETFHLDSPNERSNITRNKADNTVLNSTFNIKDSLDQNREDHLPKSDKFVLNSTFDVKEDDISSNTSDSSVGHRLNSVGDVKEIAKLQEESLKQPFLGQSYNRSATLSPSSENSTTNSPSQSEDPSNFQVYSSQDSLPDSNYSSQSLDSQPVLNPDRLGRSMPNLNKRGVTTRHPTSSSRTGNLAGLGGYRLSRYGNRHGTSETRLQTRQAADQSNRKEPPGRLETSRLKAPSQVGPGPPYNPPPPSQPCRPTSGTRIARPMTNIPRPGSRLPMFRGKTTTSSIRPPRN